MTKGHLIVLKPQGADHTETATEIIDIPVNNNKTTVNVSKNFETDSNNLSNHKNNSNSTDENQQVFWLVPPIILQQ